MKYRAEIDGLRALAVVPVILFHAGFEFFSGGFIGVDVFFVISGYLITTILIEDIENNRFSIANFYERRARRILPVLFVVLMFVYVISWLVFLPDPNKIVGQYIVASIFSGSNILLYLKGQDYFGLEDSSNPLFHTWSLGVEEQFYVVIPILLLVFWGPQLRRQLLLVVSIISLSVAINFIKIDNTSFNFYMVVSRAWELGFGMLAAVILRNFNVRPNSGLAFLGLGLITFSLVLIHKEHELLNLLMVFPVLGSFLIIVFSTESVFVGRLLSRKPLVMIGLISYSLYLWHVPLYTYMKYLWGSSNTILVGYFIALAVFSLLSYYFVERPYRNRKLVTVPRLIISTLSVAVVMTGFGVVGHINDGFPSRSKVFENLTLNNGWGVTCDGNTGIHSDCSSSNEPNIAVLGNSYSMVFVKPLVETLGQEVVQLTKNSCAVGFVDQVDRGDAAKSISCEQFYRTSVDTINQSRFVDTVVISSPFTREVSNQLFSDSFLKLLGDLEGRRLIVIGPTPRAPFSVGECVFKQTFFESSASCDFDVSEVHKLKVAKLKSLIGLRDSADFIDITDVICPNGICTMKIDNDDAMYTDFGHLSLTGSKRVLESLSSVLQFRRPR